jgi:hypothetical protein
MLDAGLGSAVNAASGLGLTVMYPGLTTVVTQPAAVVIVIVTSYTPVDVYTCVTGVFVPVPESPKSQEYETPLSLIPVNVTDKGAQPETTGADKDPIEPGFTVTIDVSTASCEQPSLTVTI